jgi:hypothetical protein
MSFTCTCAHCGAQFTRPSRQRCCSRSCSTKMQRVRQGDAWLLEHNDWLRKQSGQPIVTIVARYAQKATEQGWPPRSWYSLRQQMLALGVPYPRRRKAVKNLDTGIVYPSAAQAAREVFADQSGICHAARRGTLSVGCRWAYVDEGERA